MKKEIEKIRGEMKILFRSALADLLRNKGVPPLPSDWEGWGAVSSATRSGLADEADPAYDWWRRATAATDGRLINVSITPGTCLCRECSPGAYPPPEEDGAPWEGAPHEVSPRDVYVAWGSLPELMLGVAFFAATSESWWQERGLELEELVADASRLAVAFDRAGIEIDLRHLCTQMAKKEDGE